MILADRFAIDPTDVREGVTYRYVGFYGSMIKALFRRSPESSVFWYSVNDNSLRIITKNGCMKHKASMMSAVIHAVSETCKKKSYLAAIVAFAPALPRVNRIFEYLFALSFSRLFSIKNVKLIVDDFDPPVQALYAFSETKPSLILITYFQIMEKMTLSLASSIVVISEFWKNHMVRLYGIKETKLSVVSNGSLTRLIPQNCEKPHRPFMVLYSGSAWKVKDIDKLIMAVENLRAQGMDIELHIAGQKLMDLPSWVHITESNWKDFVSDILVNSDVCVIPYSPTKFKNSLPAKIFDYMAAGKPIISTNLEEVSNIILSNNCGLIARDWTEFETHLKRLYEDRELAKQLGNNGRKAAEKYFNYEKLAESFLERTIKEFKITKIT